MILCFRVFVKELALYPTILGLERAKPMGTYENKFINSAYLNIFLPISVNKTYLGNCKAFTVVLESHLIIIDIFFLILGK